LVRGPGANGIVATSSIGEFVHLTREERWRCFEVCLDQAQKHPRLIAEGVKQGDLPRTVEIQSSGRLMR
jgi:dihydrodipicolinate synthase/N-acetylneuraminate lyase